MADTSGPDKKPEAKSAKADSKAKASEKKAPASSASASADSTSKKSDDTSAQAKSSSVPSGGSAKPASSASATDKKTGGDAGKSGGGGRGFFTFMIVIALLGGGAYATREVWLPEVEPHLPAFLKGGDKAETETVSKVDALAERIASLEQSLAAGKATDDAPMAALKQETARAQSELTQALTRIDDLERKLAEVRALASAVTSSTGGDIDLGPVLSRIDELEQKERSTNSEVASLNQKIDTMAQNSSGGSGGGQGMVLAIAQLRDAALSGRPYAAQLMALQSVGVGNPDIIAAATRLNANADQGLPGMDTLQSRFSAIAGDIVSLARAGGGDWLDQAAGKLSQLVALRRTDGASGDPVEDAVADIEKSLKARDITAAVKTADALAELLQSDARAELEPWLLDAKARATAERALDAMHASALAALDK